MRDDDTSVDGGLPLRPDHDQDCVRRRVRPRQFPEDELTSTTRVNHRKRW